MDYAHTNTHSSQGESQLYIFEDNEAVIKMIIKGRSPTTRHVSRTHRVANDWLFDRINLEPKIQIKYVDTKKQTCWHANQRDFHAWRVEPSSSFDQHNEFLDVLLQPLQPFLIRSESRAPCQREVKKRLPVRASPMAKPKPMVPAKATHRQLGVTQRVKREGQSSAGFGISSQSGECRWRTRLSD